jgi:hypothetical protein
MRNRDLELTSDDFNGSTVSICPKSETESPINIVFNSGVYIMTEVTNTTEEANISTIETVLTNAINSFVPTPNAHPMSTDPIPPIHHLNLIDNIADITDYINEQTQKHKELMVHIESFKDKLTEVSADMKNYHVEDKFAAAKKFVEKEEKAFLGLTTAHKIEIVIVAVVAIGIIISAFKFL